MNRTEDRWPQPMLALMTPAELPAVDAYMEQSGTSGYALMERAGAAIAEAARVLAPSARRVVVAAGPTNNGGDCLCAARFMRGAGLDVVVSLLGARETLRSDPARAAAAWTGTLVPAAAPVLADADLIVDGLYGGGLAHPIAGEAESMVAAINTAGRPVLAVDFPTGISGGAGTVLGSAVRADMTITFFCLKPGHLLLPGRSHCGTVVVDNIGIPASIMDAIRPLTFQNRPDLWLSALSGGAEPGTAAPSILTAAGTDDLADGLQRACAAASPPLIVTCDRAFAGIFPDARSKVERARRAAEASGGVVAIVGGDPVVAVPDGRAAIAGNGAPAKTAPTDCAIIATVIREHLERGVPGFEAAAAAAWALGEAQGNGDRAAAMSALLKETITRARRARRNP